MEVAQNDTGSGTVILALACIMIGFYASRVVKNMHAVAQGLSQLREWRWVQQPIIFAPPPQLHQKQQTILRSDEHEVSLASTVYRGARLVEFRVRLANRPFVSCWTCDGVVVRAEYHPPETSLTISAWGILLRRIHPMELQVAEEFCQICLDEVEHWQGGTTA